MKLCLKQMSNKGTFNQMQEISMDFRLWSSTMETQKLRRGDLKHTKGYERSDPKRKISLDRVWDRQGSETGTKSRMKNVGRTFRWNRRDLGCME